MRLTSEAKLQIQVARYLANNYPEVQFHSDFGSGAYLTKTQAAIQGKQNAGRRGWPDMFIAQPIKKYLEKGKRSFFSKIGRDHIERYGDWRVACAAGLFIELKADGVRLKKKNGEWATPHIAEQAEVLEQLRRCGYAAEFAVGFDEAKKVIDEYLS